MATWFGLRIKVAHSTRPADAPHMTSADASGHPPVRARIVEPAPATWEAVVTVEGSLRPVREADLGFRTGGRLLWVHAQLGDRVRAGDVLATLDPDEAAARVAVAAAEVRANEARLHLAEDTRERTSRLVAAGARPAAESVESNAQQQLADAQLEAAKGQLALATAMLWSHSLIAPFAGTITHVPDGEGAVVSPGVPVFHLMDLSSLKLVGTIGGDDAALVKVGQTVETDLDGRHAVGRVAARLGAVDPSTRRVPIEVRFPNDGPEPILAGRYVTGFVRAGGSVPVLRLPGTALRPGSQDEVMRAVDGALVAQKITFAKAADGSLLVRSGLSAGDAVLDAPAPEAQAGDRLDMSASNAGTP